MYVYILDGCSSTSYRRSAENGGGQVAKRSQAIHLAAEPAGSDGDGSPASVLSYSKSSLPGARARLRPGPAVVYADVLVAVRPTAPRTRLPTTYGHGPRLPGLQEAIVESRHHLLLLLFPQY